MANKNFFGLDIGDSSIKLVYLQRDNQSSKLLAYGLAPTPGNGMTSEADFDKDAIVEIIKRLTKETKVNTNQVIAALPESQIFTRIIEMPPMSEKELSSAIKFESEQYIPRPLNEVSLRWQILTKGDKEKGQKMEVLIVAAPLTLIEKYTEILKKADLKPIAMETDLLAQARSLVGNNPYSPTTMVVSIGSTNTDLSIIRGGMVSFTRSIASGGVTLTRAIASDLSLEFEQAEQYKKTYGLLEDQLEGKVMSAVKPTFELIINELKKAITLYQTKNPNDQVKRVVLAGGTAKLPGLLIFLANALGIEAQVGDPWFNIKKDPNIEGQLKEDAPIYSVAVGLALKEI
ncbi:MAG: type IV pilus assembly protein PilM [bacterium]|nr:type IV pilus assembly protein PilM [bacterium]